MYFVYWKDGCGVDGELHSDLGAALAACELHRSLGHRFVTMAIENPNMVGKMGVAEVDENYSWVKRRDSLSARKKDIV